MPARSAIKEQPRFATTRIRLNEKAGVDQHGEVELKLRLPGLLRWLAESKPDVACLQELKAPPEKFPEAALREAGYGAVWHGEKSWNRVAILARGL